MRTMIHRGTLPTALLAAFALMPGGIVRGQNYNITTVDDPAGVHGTWIYGVYQNTVAGYYDTPSGVHGFTLTGGTFTIVDNPYTGSTFLSGIYGNTVVGWGNEASGSIGFTATGGVFAQLADPASPTYTIPYCTDGTTTVGLISINSIYHGFSETNGVYTTITGPSATDTYAQGVYGGTVAGSYFYGGKEEGYTYTNGVFTTINDPLGIEGSGCSGIYGDTVVGIYMDSSGESHGFFEEGGVYTTLDVPGAAFGGTTIMAIYGNTVVGYYDDANNFPHGFIATIPEPGTCGALTLGAAALLLRRRKGQSMSAVRPAGNLPNTAPFTRLP